MKVEQVTHHSSPTVGPDTCIAEAARVLRACNAGAAAVMEGSRLVGVVSERDVAFRVVAEGKDPRTTKVREVMTKSVRTVTTECGTEEALTVMVENHIRHVVVLNRAGLVVGIASSRDVFQAHVEALDDQVRSLAAFVGADGNGG